jgi:pyrimidine-nucleoside phosphorylase
MIYLAGLAKNHVEGIKKAKAALDSGRALENFRELIRNQGGDEKIVDDYSRLPQTKLTYEIKAPKSGYITSVLCKNIGLHCVELGGGRKQATDKIDFAVGLYLHKKINEPIKKGDVLVTIHYHEKQKAIVENIANQILKKDFKFSTKKAKTTKLILETKTKFANKK